MNAILARYRALPFVGKAVVWALAVVVLFFGVVDPLLGVADRVAARADGLEAALARRRALADESSPDSQFLAAARAAYGRPLMPGEGGAKPETIYRLVDGVLAGHGVTDRTITESKSRLPGDAARTLGAGEIDRLTLTVTFEADAATVMDIVGELEKAREISAVSRVKLDKSGVRDQSPGEDVVRATIVPEAWLPARAGEVTQ